MELVELVEEEEGGDQRSRGSYASFCFPWGLLAGQQAALNSLHLSLVPLQFDPHLTPSQMHQSSGEFNTSMHICSGAVKQSGCSTPSPSPAAAGAASEARACCERAEMRSRGSRSREAGRQGGREGENGATVKQSKCQFLLSLSLSLSSLVHSLLFVFSSPETAAANLLAEEGNGGLVLRCCFCCCSSSSLSLAAWAPLPMGSIGDHHSHRASGKWGGLTFNQRVPFLPSDYRTPSCSRTRFISFSTPRLIRSAIDGFACLFIHHFHCLNSLPQSATFSLSPSLSLGRFLCRVRLPFSMPHSQSGVQPQESTER